MTLECPPAQDFIIMGATGDLGRRKLLPALYNLHLSSLLPEVCKICGYTRGGMSEEDFRAFAADAVRQFSRRPLDERIWPEFARRLGPVLSTREGMAALKDVSKADLRVVYLAVPPSAVTGIVEDLAEAGLVEGTRLVVEKPFGHDLQSARALNRTLRKHFDEQHIFRIDHYLGKETVQNVLAFRFANSAFENNWQRGDVESVEINVAESIGMEGRGSFYEEVGALRDIVQNHVLQMLAVLAMEPPASFDPERIRDEKSKLLEATRPVRPEDVVMGQYTAGSIGDDHVPAYREEPGVAPDSRTETFVAMRLFIDTWRWAGIPFYVRTGKRLPRRSTQVTVRFDRAPIPFFKGTGIEQLPANHLTIDIQPSEGIVFAFLAKVPGPEVTLQAVSMRFNYEHAFMTQPEEAYERLLHDVMQCDHTLFVRQDAVEAAWGILQPIIEHRPEVCLYRAGSWGPREAEELIAPGEWHLR